jgi:glyoxylase-like metal-dependent hydrolase (beta-lactamase superfamily II)
MVLFLTVSRAAIAQANAVPLNDPGCEQLTPKQCLNLALNAMGGRDRLQKVKNMRLQTIGHTLLMEQSYRQDPFITSYETAQTTLDFVNGRVLSDVKLTWPETDAGQSQVETVTVVGPEGGVRRGKDGDSPCSLADLAVARYALALGPSRILLAADAAPDLRFEKSEVVRSTLHSALAFTWQGEPVRILVNRFNHLPDAVEATQQFYDFWFFWGDVKQRIYFENWRLMQGIEYPTNLVEERNGAIWRSTQALNVEFNIPLDESAFRIDGATAKKSSASRGWNRPFRADKVTTLAPAIDFLPGPWNSTVVKQSDGIVIVEAPIGEPYTQGILEEAKKRYPGLPIKAILSTSDSWPHTGGVRFAVSKHLPVYILDLNRPLLDRLIHAPHSLDPDNLEKSTERNTPVWKIVSAKEEIGSGPNRIELYPVRGAATERQYMVYFPEHHLLYASDTLVINDDNTLYDPELMHEVVQAVNRENLKVDTVFAMHQGPTPWTQVLTLLEKSQGS